MIQIEWLEQQKQEQLALLQRIEEQKIQLEVDLLKAQMQGLEGDIKKEQEKTAPQSQAIQMIDQDPAMNQQQETELKVKNQQLLLYGKTELIQRAGRDVKLYYQLLY